MPETVLANARLRDWKELDALFARCFPAIPAAERAYNIRTYGRGTRLIRVNGQLAGFTVHVDGKGAGVAWVEQIGADPAFRGRGLGRLLLRDFEEQAARSGHHRVELAVERANAAAVALYESCGYSRSDRPGEKLTYVKELPAEQVAPGGPLPRNRVGNGALARLLARVAFRLLVGRGAGPR